MRQSLVRAASVVAVAVCLASAGPVLVRTLTAQAQMDPGTPDAMRRTLDLGSPDALRRTLEAQAGKRVKVKLLSGQDLDGVVGPIGSYAVTLTELTGLEFYDATIRLDQIAAVIVRVRGGR
jgi:hypothetical protein